MPDTVSPSGRIALNIMQFCRVLRAAGLPIGPGKVLQALEAVQTVGLGRRQDLYWTLHASLVNRRDQRPIFDQAFHIFWRNPDLLKRAMALMLPSIDGGKQEDREQVIRRLAEAMADRRTPGDSDTRDDPEPPELDIDATLTFSDKEVLQHIDFEQMSSEELDSGPARHRPDAAAGPADADTAFRCQSDRRPGRSAPHLAPQPAAVAAPASNW